jgi:hypothetical protein
VHTDGTRSGHGKRTLQALSVLLVLLVTLLPAGAAAQNDTDLPGLLLEGIDQGRTVVLAPAPGFEQGSGLWLDGTADLYHPLGPNGLESDRIDIVDVETQLWVIDGTDAWNTFVDAFDPDLQDADGVVRVTPDVVPSIPPADPLLVATFEMADTTPFADPTLQPDWLAELTVAWDYDTETFSGLSGDLFDGAGAAAGVRLTPDSNYETFTSIFDGEEWQSTESMTFAWASSRWVSIAFPLYQTELHEGPIHVNFGSFACVGPEVSYAPEDGGVDILSDNVDFELQVPAFRWSVTEPASASTQAETTTAPSTMPESPTTVSDDAGVETSAADGTFPWMLLIVIGVLLLVAAVSFSWGYAPARLEVDAVVPGTEYVLCAKVGCRFHKDGICKGSAAPRPCSQGCVCRVFRRKRGPRWDGKWEYCEKGRPPLPKNRLGYKYYCLCVK